MSYLPFLICLLFILVISFIKQKSRNNYIKKQIAFDNDSFSDQIMGRKNSVKCEAFNSGKRTSAYRFTNCDLIFFKDSFVIIGYTNFGGSKSLTKYLKFSNGLVNNTDRLKKINLHSFGNDVYIEFGESSFTSTNVEIRLKNLTEEEKNLIKVN